MNNLSHTVLKWANQEPVPTPSYGAFLEANEQPLVERIRSRGLHITSLWKDLVNPKPEFLKLLPEVVDLLIESLDDQELHPRILGGIILTLGNEVIAKRRDLFDYFSNLYLLLPPGKQLKNPQARGLDGYCANAIVGHFQPEHLEKLKVLLLDETLGESRVLLLRALRKYKKTKPVQEVLLSLRGIPTLEKELKASFGVS